MRDGGGRPAAGGGGPGVGAPRPPVGPPPARPRTAPPGTAPTGGATVSGSSVPVSASSEAPLVQFYADAMAIGTPVPGTGTTGNPQTVSTQWSSWSFANGMRMLSAADCDSGNPACNATQA